MYFQVSSNLFLYWTIVRDFVYIIVGIITLFTDKIITKYYCQIVLLQLEPIRVQPKGLLGEYNRMHGFQQSISLSLPSQACGYAPHSPALSPDNYYQLYGDKIVDREKLCLFPGVLLLLEYHCESKIVGKHCSLPSCCYPCFP